MAKPTAAPQEELLPMAESLQSVYAQPAVDYSPAVIDIQKRVADLENRIESLNLCVGRLGKSIENIDRSGECQDALIDTLTAALAVKDKQHQAMIEFICEMNGRLFCYEMTTGRRGLNSARFDVSGINFQYPGTHETYKMVYELTMNKLRG